jgi:hypothetical protein
MTGSVENLLSVNICLASYYFPLIHAKQIYETTTVLSFSRGIKKEPPNFFGGIYSLSIMMTSRPPLSHQLTAVGFASKGSHPI